MNNHSMVDSWMMDQVPEKQPLVASQAYFNL